MKIFVYGKYQIAEFSVKATGKLVTQEALETYLGIEEAEFLIDQIVDKGAVILREFGLNEKILNSLSKTCYCDNDLN